MVHLLDVNLLIALAWPQHVHHSQGHEWFERVGHKAWATCPITQMAFVRISSNPKIIPDAVSPRQAVAALRQMTSLAGHEFWSDDIAPVNAETFLSLSMVGHRQVTDAYLLALAMHHSSKLATLDKEVTNLLPASKDKQRNLTLVN